MKNFFFALLLKPKLQLFLPHKFPHIYADSRAGRHRVSYYYYFILRSFARDFSLNMKEYEYAINNKKIVQYWTKNWGKLSFICPFIFFSYSSWSWQNRKVFKNRFAEMIKMYNGLERRHRQIFNPKHLLFSNLGSRPLVFHTYLLYHSKVYLYIFI